MMKRHDIRTDRRRSRTRRFLENQFGSATIEFVIWLPWFFMLLMLTVDASFMYMSLTRMENAARDAARRVAVGQFDRDEIEIYAKSQLPDLDYTIDPACTTTDYACVSVTQPTNKMLVFGEWGMSFFLGQSMGSTVKMRLEPGVCRLLFTANECLS